jgi:hypothetical protein
VSYLISFNGKTIMANKQVAAKSGDVHIYSTLANPQKFVTYEYPDARDPVQAGRLPVEKVSVLIKGGSGVASKNLITEWGVRTVITQQEYEAICELHHFKEFVKNGYLRVESKSVDIDRIVSDMNASDPGAPLTPADYANEKADGSTPVPVELDKAGTGWVANQLSNR